MKLYHVTYTVTTRGKTAQFTEDWMGFNRHDVCIQIKEELNAETSCNSSIKILRIHR